MRRLNQDAVIAILLLVASGILFWSTFSIRVPDYGVLSPSTWPRIIILSLSVLSIIYLLQSLKESESESNAGQSVADRPPGFAGWVVYWKNPIICFSLFFLFLLTLPILGSLIGGVLFVFSLMSALGGLAPRDIALHAMMALITIGGMWTIFTYGLGVILPTGVIFSPF